MVRVIRSVLLVTLVLGIGAATAQGRVGTPQRVSPAGLAVHESAVAAGGSRIAVLMAGSGDLEARLGGAGGFGRTQRLDGSSFAAHVAVGADGTAVAVWTASAHAKVALRVAIARPGHDFGRARTLSHAASHALGDAVAVTTSGRAVVAWIGGTNGHSVQVAVAAPGRPFGAPQTLGDSRQYAPVVGVAPNGTAIVAWLTTPFPLPPPAPPPPSYGRVLAVALAAGATAFGPATELGRLTTFYSGPEAASGPGGAVVSWRQADGATKLLARLSPDNGFQPAVPLLTGASAFAVTQGDHLAIGLPADGTTVALWRNVHVSLDVLKFSVVKSSFQMPGGVFAPEVQLSTSDWLAGPPQASALHDRAVAAWAESRAGHQSHVRIAVRTPDRWTALSPLPADAVNLSSVNLTASGDHAVITWVAHRPKGRLYLATYRP